MEAKRLPEGYTRQKPMAARPEKQNPPRRGKRHVVMCRNLTSAVQLVPVDDHCVVWKESQALRTAGGLKG